VELYRFLYELSSSKADTGKLISGQWFGASFAPARGNFTFDLGELVEIRKRTGKWLGMVDAWICPGEFGPFPDNDPIRDCMWYDDMIADYTLLWNNGSILHVDATFYAPLRDRYARRLEEGVVVDPDSILTAGTLENIRWRAICDRMAEFFLALQERNIPVIFRPFTEAYIQGYWYSYRNHKLGPDGFRRIYLDLWNYLTVEKGCNNILWDFQGSDQEAAYPGRKYVDVITSYSDYLAWGGDNQMKCNPDQPLPYGNAELGDYGRSQRTLDAGKTEIPWNDWVEWARQNCPHMAFYTKWWRDWGPMKSETRPGEYFYYDTGYNELLRNPYVLTRDELRFPSQPDQPELPYDDDFEGSVTELTNGRGVWSVENGTLNSTGATAFATTFYGSMDWEDYSVEASVKVESFSLTGFASILGRCASSCIYYQLGFNRLGLSLSRRFNDHLETLGTWTSDFEEGKEYRLRLEMSGNSIRGFVDTGTGLVKRIAVEDALIPFGCAGLASHLTRAGFDDLSVAALSGTSIRIPEKIDISVIGQNVPNPFSVMTRIPLFLSEPAYVRLDMLDSSGRMVENLLNCRMEGGNHFITWNGEGGKGIEPGLYFCVVQVQQKDLFEISQIKMIVQ
jgi:hypothetical protein